MGMYDYVNVEMDCPKCGEKLRGFQSKDGACTLEKIDPQYVSCLYTSCYHCKTWVEFRRGSEPERNKPRDAPFSRAEIEGLGFTLRGL